METSSKVLLPSLTELLEETAKYRSKSRVDVVEKAGLSFFGLALVSPLVVLAEKIGLITTGTLKYALIALLTLLILNGLVIAALLSAALIKAWRAGFTPLAQKTSKAIEGDRAMISYLSAWPTAELTETGKLVVLRSRLLKHRVTLATATAAASAVLMSAIEAGEKAKLLPTFADQIRLIALCGSLGLAIGAVILLAFFGRLEHLAELLALAAARGKNGTKGDEGN